MSITKHIAPIEDTAKIAIDTVKSAPANLSELVGLDGVRFRTTQDRGLAQRRVMQAIEREVERAKTHLRAVHSRELNVLHRRISALEDALSLEQRRHHEDVCSFARRNPDMTHMTEQAEMPLRLY